MKIVKPLAMAGALVLAAGLGAVASVPDDPDSTAAVRNVRKALERLPYYGVFDFLVFSVDGRTVTLQGYAHRPALRREAEDMVRKATGAEIANKIEVLPTSRFDDRIRWEAFQRVYTDEFASRYARGGPTTVRYELLDMLRFPGMEPYGTYAVHLVVKDRRLALFGVVDNEFDKTTVLLRARQVGHTTGIEDSVAVRSR